MSEHKIDVIDNFLPPEIHASLQRALESYKFDWHYLPYVAYQGSEVKNDFYFEHIFFESLNYQSDRFPLIFPILERLNAKALIKAKANMYPNVGEFLKNGLHSDQPYSHRGAVYYVNSNNGYTGFEDGTKVDSVANRIMLFDSSIMHHSTHCTDQKIRLTINFNYFGP